MITKIVLKILVEIFNLLSPILKSYLKFKGTSIIFKSFIFKLILINKSATTEKSLPIKKFFLIKLLFFNV